MLFRTPGRLIATVMIGFGILVGALFASSGAALADPPAPPGTPTASAYAGTPTVGPLFTGAITAAHGCTASVIDSPTHDLILTAAHCVSGTAAGWLFAPGYDNGKTPYGVWTVTAAFVSPQWAQTGNTQYDYAILRLAKKKVHGHLVGISQVTGGNVLGVAPHTGSTITDIAYNGGVGGQAITCTVPVYYTDGYPGFNCHGYVGGSSGSPWILSLAGFSLHVHVVVGVIGGLHQGGCYEYTSYSSAFKPDIYRLLLRASFSRTGDVVPAAGSDGC